MDNLEISSIDLKPLRVELSDLYAPVEGVDNQVNNLMVIVKLKNGYTGYGEIAPSEPLTGETLHSSRQAVLQLGESIRGLSVDRYRAISQWMKERVPGKPSVRCGLETAILDAFCRSLQIPMWAFFGGKVKSGFTTDITLPLLPVDRTLALAEYWFSNGFDTLKMKVGIDLEEEIAIVRAIQEKHSEIKFVFDASQGFTEEEAILFITEVISLGCEVVLYEQPLHREDLDGMARIRKEVPVPLVADESVLTLQDLKKVINKQAADVINIKIMKSGLLEAVDIAVTAKAMDMKLMIGGMMETRLATGCSLSLAAGLGIVNYYDIGRPLLLKTDPFTGGFEYEESDLRISEDPGLGIVPLH
jgi:L-alanine-DL-glutamate epimerase-like enolase superfamily enzyme